MKQATPALIAEGRAVLADLSAQIDSEFDAPQGIEALNAHHVSMWTRIAPRLAALSWAHGNVEGWLYCAETRGETRLTLREVIRSAKAVFPGAEFAA